MADTSLDRSRSGLLAFFGSGRGMIVVAALLWSTSAFFAKAPWFDDWPVESRGMGLAFWRAVFAAMTVAPFIRQVELRWSLVPMSGCFAAMTSSFLMSMVMGNEATTIWLQYVAPAWVGIAGYMGLTDRPRRADLPMMGISLASVIFIVAMQTTFGGEALQARAAALALFSGLMFAGVILSLRHMRFMDPAWLGFVNHFGTVICLAPFVINRVPIPHGGQWLALLLLGAVQIAMPYLLFAAAVKRVEPAEASLLTLLEPIAVPVWTAMVWSHLDSYRPPPWWVMVAGGCIALGFVERFWAARRLKRENAV
jgi:drug/metabolite transporter, DME family